MARVVMFRGEITRWATELRLFAPDVEAALDGMCAHLSLVVGAMAAPPFAEEGDVDGFDGLVTRGVYERLVLSEWLLANEIPEEFDRRAAMGEHLFLKVARRHPDARRTSVALFDPSASQLGAPRAVQLAVLLTLARRAAVARARFVWSIVGRPDLFDTIDVGTIRAFLAARTPGPLRAEDVERRQRELAPTPSPPEVWLVGGRDCVGRAPHVITLEDTFEVREAVRVRVHTRSAAPREALLRLPEDAGTTARILRSPWLHASPGRAARSPAATSNLVFSQNGGKLFARGENHTMLVIPVPNSPRVHPPGRVRVLHARGPVLAVGGGRQRRWLVVDELTGHLALRNEPARGGERVAEPGALPLDHDALAPLFLVDGRWHLLWGSSLLRFDRNATHAIALGVYDVVPTSGGLCFVCASTTLERPPDDGAWLVVSYAAGRTKVRSHVDKLPVRALVACADGSAAGPMIAYTSNGQTWMVDTGATTTILSPSGEAVLGIVRKSARDVLFVMLDEGGRVIRLTSQADDVRLVRTAAPIREAALGSNGMLAWLTEDNELGFASVPRREVFQLRQLG